MIYVDAPLWPAHGTRFAHLVSDGDVEELHAFAASLGMSRRAFDGDHYDLPERLHAAAVDAGACPVDRRGMVGIVRAARRRRTQGSAGQGHAGQERAGQGMLADALRERWDRLAARVHPAPDRRAWREAGEELLARWREPHRAYHDLSHLAAVLRRLDVLGSELGSGRRDAQRGVGGSDGVTDHCSGGGSDEAACPGEAHRIAAELAAWFHDAVHTGASPGDEHASAELALARLTHLGLQRPAPATVAQIVLATDPTAARSDAASDGAAADGAATEEGLATDLFVDADLGVLAGDVEEYAAYVRDVRREYPQVSDTDFARGRGAVLRSLLARPRLFRTPLAHRDWEPAARANIESELRALEAVG